MTDSPTKAPAPSGPRPAPPAQRKAAAASGGAPVFRPAPPRQAGESFTLPISGRRIALALLAGALAMIPVVINENGKPPEFAASAELFLPTSGVNPNTTAAYFDDFQATMFSSQGLLKDAADLNGRNGTDVLPLELIEIMELERLGQGTAVRLTATSEDEAFLQDLVPNAIRRTLAEVEGREVQEIEIRLTLARDDYQEALEVFRAERDGVDVFDPVGEYNRLRSRAESLRDDARSFELQGLTGAAATLKAEAVKAETAAEALEDKLDPIAQATVDLDRAEAVLETVEEEHAARTARLDAVEGLSRVSPTVIQELSKIPSIVRNGGAAAAVAALLVLLLGSALDASRGRKPA